MKHKHADMIKAKADDMELVVFCKFEDKDWIESRVDFADSFSFLCEYQYFLCLPQHEEICLHWLNGGEVQEQGFYNKGGFGSIEVIRGGKWNLNHIFMDGSSKFRVKPKKEKRWIRVADGGSSLDSMFLFESEDVARSGFDYQVLQIEVEI